MFGHYGGFCQHLEIMSRSQFYYLKEDRITMRHSLISFFAASVS